MEGEKVLHVHYLGGLEKCWVEVSHLHKGLGVGRGDTRCTKINLVIPFNLQLHATSSHLQLCFIIFTTSHCLVKFYDYFCDHGATIKLHILPLDFLDFSTSNRFLSSFSCKISCNLVIYYGVFIHLMYIRVLCITLKIYYIDLIQSI
jgi:hypothetical protein